MAVDADEILAEEVAVGGDGAAHGLHAEEEQAEADERLADALGAGIGQGHWRMRPMAMPT
jgi:hypothetical protein